LKNLNTLKLNCTSKLHVVIIKTRNRCDCNLGQTQDCGHFVFISHIEPKNIHEAEVDSYWLLVIEELNQFEYN